MLCDGEIVLSYETQWVCVSFINALSAFAVDEAARVHESNIPRSVTGTGACRLAWASGDIDLVVTHTDESRSFRQDGPLEVLRSPICF